MDERGLTRHLRLWDAVAIFVGIILGSGIFVAPAAVSGAAPSLPIAVALWLVGACVAACGAFTYAECASRLPHTGGFFVFYREVYGDAVAFVGGWAAILVTYPASVAAIALILERYLVAATGFAIPAGSAAAGAIAAAGLLNAAGLRTGPRTQRVLTASKVSVLAVLCAAAVLHGPGAAAAPAAPAQPATQAAMLLGALVAILWTYDGWSDVTLVAGEIRQPERNVGRAVTAGVVVLALLYAGVQASVLSLLPASTAAGSEGVVAEAVRAGLGERTGTIVAWLVVVCTFGSVHGVVFAVSRLGFAMARARVFPGWFGAIDPRFRTPARATAAITASAIVYVFVASFRELLGYFTFAVWIFYGASAVALFVLRRRGIGGRAGWRAPLGPLAPAVVLVSGAVMTVSLFASRPKSGIIGLALLAAGFPVYAAWRRLSGGSASRSR